MRDESNSSFAIIRYNARTYEGGGVAAVVKGRDTAEATLKQIERCQDSADHDAGWRYFLEKSDLKPGMDPQEATNLRQARFDMQDMQG